MANYGVRKEADKLRGARPPRLHSPILALAREGAIWRIYLLTAANADAAADSIHV